MLRTVEAVIDEHGNIRLREPVHLPAARRALVTILDDEPALGIPEMGFYRFLVDTSRSVAQDCILRTAGFQPAPPGTRTLQQESVLLSESALAEYWSRPEEDAAWSYLQSVPSS
jgi:hypothetical protein